MMRVFNWFIAVVFVGLAFSAGPASALPPSSSLSGKEGKLTWKVSSTDNGIKIEGKSHKWRVTHHARADLTPISTEHVDDDGKVRVEYTKTGATIHRNGETKKIEQAGLWDGDTVDVRLGQVVAVHGKKKVEFDAVDPGGGKVYGFEAKLKGTEKCGKVACLHVKLTMTGAYRWVGPKWEYWFGPDGELLRFEGPIGDYTAK